MNDTDNSPNFPIGFSPKSGPDLIEALRNTPELVLKYNSLNKFAGIAYVGWLKMDFLAALAI